MSVAALLLPLFSFFILLLFGNYLPRKGDWLSIACTAVAGLFALIIVFFCADAGLVLALPAIHVGTINIPLGFVIDHYAALMLVLITVISFVVQVFSITYMQQDADYKKYWLYLSLFTFAMMGLVLSDNLLLLYIFWELVGFLSYLLIGFWYTKEAASTAAKKAFIVNRIGDIGFLIGILILYNQCHTFTISTILQTFDFSAPWGQAAGICLFMGAVAKSAQFPLFVWLPDAMEGPTPVSALIHAATMVAAGVYLLARLFPLFDEPTLQIITITGTVTALVAATIAMAQYDIKKVLAYSTISQLGLMVAGIGSGAVAAAMFHLSTHAFFKALLFLVAGVVMHQLKYYFKEQKITADYQDMRLMGGLKKDLPIVFYAYMVGAAALVGLPFFSGFLSKDALLDAALHTATQRGGWWLLIPIAQFATVLLTAIYITRHAVLIFFGEKRFVASKVKTMPAKTATYPLIFLAICCFFFLFSANPMHVANSWLFTFIGGNGAMPMLWVSLLSILLALLGIGVSYYCIYHKKQFDVIATPTIHTFLLNAWFIDSFYAKIIVKPLNWLSMIVTVIDIRVIDSVVNGTAKLTRIVANAARLAEQYIIDAAINGIASFTSRVGNRFQQVQTGQLQTYIAGSIAGLVLVLLWLIV